MQDNWTTLREQLELFSKPFPKAAIAFANSHRDELAPHLIEVLAQVAANPVVPDGYMLHEYALQLLAAWADPRAYAPMVALGHYDEDTLDALLGDTVTESYGRCLASVCDGDLAPLKALFEDTKASFWARSAALDAMVVRVIEGDYPRDALVQYLIAHGDSEAQRLREPGLVGDLEVIDCIVTAACDLVALEMHERIEGWFDEGLLDSMCTDKPWVAFCMAKTFESERQATLERGKGYVRDVEAQMGWWACFAEGRPESLMPQYPLSNPRSDFLEAGQTVVRSAPKIGRNDACPCGSGKKYKKCCGAS